MTEVDTFDLRSLCRQGRDWPQCYHDGAGHTINHVPVLQAARSGRSGMRESDVAGG
jgi:hypothetical protein